MTDEEFAKTFPTMTWLLPSPPKPAWSDLPGNVVPSAVNAATDLYEMARHPVRTLQALETVAGGATNLLGADELNAYLADRGLAVRRNPQDVAREETAATAVGQALKDRYWGLDNLKRTIITDPFGSALDVVGVATGVGGAIRGGLSVGSKARLAEIPGAALNAERPAIPKLGEMIAPKDVEMPPIDKQVDIPIAEKVTQDNLREAIFADAKRNKIYAPPSKPKRRFDEDYTEDLPADGFDEAGNLMVDRRGKRLASWITVFGRRMRGGDDVGASYKDFRELAKRLMGEPIQVVPREHIEGKSGTVPFDPDTNTPKGIFLADDLDMRKSRSRHISTQEIMHVLDLKTGREPVPPEVWREMESVYSTLATGQENLPKLTLPADRGYSGLQIRDELVAESFRAALKDPNYMKTVAPKTYDWLADRLERHPNVGVRLNSVGAVPIAVFGMMGQEDKPEATEALKDLDTQTSPFRESPPLPGMSAPIRFVDEAAEERPHGQAEFAKALAQHKLGSTTPKNEIFINIARALVGLEPKQKHRLLGGPR